MFNANFHPVNPKDKRWDLQPSLKKQGNERFQCVYNAISAEWSATGMWLSELGRQKLEKFWNFKANLIYIKESQASQSEIMRSCLKI